MSHDGELIELERPSSPPRFWRSLEERAGSDEFLAAVHREFPIDASVWNDATSRRAFLQRMAASLALAGMAGCARQPDETIVPYVNQPENIVPGRPQVFASAIPEPGGAIGVLVKSHTGRPTMLEGNPKHPASLGAAGCYAQASLLELYDPDRSQTVRRNGRISNWTSFSTEFTKRLKVLRSHEGAGLAILTGEITSPTLLDQLSRLLQSLPQATWHVHNPLADDTRRGTAQAFGSPLVPRYHLENSDVVVSFDADFFGLGAARLRLAREFFKRRQRGEDGTFSMNRLHVAEVAPTITGARADHRLPASTKRLGVLLARVAGDLGVEVPAALKGKGDLSDNEKKWVAGVVADLRAAGKNGVVIVGGNLSPALQGLGYALNARLENLGSAITFVKPIDQPADRAPQSLADLNKAIDAGKVETLVVLGTNPIYDAPADLHFVDYLARVPYTVQQGLAFDETAARCLWHVPLAHSLESWGDCRGEDGTASLIQPLIAPLHEGRSAHDLFDLMLDEPGLSDLETVKAFWKRQQGNATDIQFQNFWNRSLHEGIVADSAAESVQVTLSGDWASVEGTRPTDPDEKSGGPLELVFRPDPHILDGRYANNGWLQELPRPLNKLTWGNAAWISPEEADRRKLKTGDVVELEAESRRIRIPVWVMPGQPADVISVSLGHGRKQAGRVGNDVGVDVFPLRTTSTLWSSSCTIRPTTEHVQLATTQMHQMLEGEGIIRTGTLEEFRAHPEHPVFMSAGAHHHGGHGEGGQLPTLYPEWPKKGEQWGMAINLATCIGCNACTIACQAENNIPIVGAEQVITGREMHWIRVDTYFAGEVAEPDVHFQPVPCMHCEHAPCEVVCPVAATTHSHDGLNEMTYNRCIGTRYCSNNCPYKVRRFNFLDYHEETESLPILQLGQNPEVTVRSRGVMEKCTYCVQRIWNARIQSQLEDRGLKDGDVVTACQAACPTEAIVFGDISDPTSRVSKAKAGSLNYSLLGELNTRPRTTYLADLRNPRPKEEESATS